MEANENCSEEIERKIEIICRRQGSILVISISNSAEDGTDTFCMDVFSGSGAWHEVAERTDWKGVDSFRA